ncbi:serine/threonine protein kinase [Robertmurraya sp. FSL R5-0851]|uniref:serine/threonine protein kinase n=1 Tax=Robertmurraya sp. FSL R5-0851 TaxID=2921584 RepID=UPI0030FBEA51
MMIFKPIVLAFSSLMDKELAVGEKINERYIIEKFLGMGSYGHSYLVYDSHLEKKVVLKLVRFHKRITKKGIRIHQYEIEILKSLQHSSFPTVFDEGMWGRIPFFTMEFIHGKTFEQLIFTEGQRFTEEESLLYGLKLLERIEYLHQRGIVHRDLRIPNLMLEGEDLKVIDFGLAKWLSHTDNKKRDLKSEISPQADYFQLGHFLLFLLYSNYETTGSEKERPWDEELSLSTETNQLIKRLLQVEKPFETINELKACFLFAVNKGRNKHVTF